MGDANIDENFRLWFQEAGSFKLIDVFITWVVWNMRIKAIFQDVVPNVLLCGIKGICLFKDFLKMDKTKKLKVIYSSVQSSLLVVGYFDRVSSNDSFGCGMVLIINKDFFKN